MGAAALLLTIGGLAVDTSRLVPCRYLDGGNASGPYGACIDFGTSSLGACHQYVPRANKSDIFECGCIALVGEGPRAQTALSSINAWEMRQAIAQFALSSASIVLGGSYLLLFAMRYEHMARYPQSLAFWMYFCDMLKSISLCVVAGVRLYSGLDASSFATSSTAMAVLRSAASAAASSFASLLPAGSGGGFGGNGGVNTGGGGASAEGLTPAWVHTSSAPCLCDAIDSHPGCTCVYGLLATMLQVRRGGMGQGRVRGLGKEKKVGKNGRKEEGEGRGRGGGQDRFPPGVRVLTCASGCDAARACQAEKEGRGTRGRERGTRGRTRDRRALMYTQVDTCVYGSPPPHSRTARFPFSPPPPTTTCALPPPCYNDTSLPPPGRPGRLRRLLPRPRPQLPPLHLGPLHPPLLPAGLLPLDVLGRRAASLHRLSVSGRPFGDDRARIPRGVSRVLVSGAKGQRRCQ